MTAPASAHPSPLLPNARSAGAIAASVLGHTMAVHPLARDRFVSASLRHAGCFEPFLTELVVNTVRPGDTVLDVGAHIGYYTLLLARLVGPGGRVVALEPDPDNFTLLAHNVARNGYASRVSLYNLAAAETPGRLALYRSADNAGDHRIHPAESDRPAVAIEAMTVDGLFRQRSGGIDFIKMDVQGAEGTALEGMAGLLTRSRRAVMLLEFWPLGLARAGYPAQRLLERLGSLGFRLYEVDESQGSVRRVDPRALLERFPATQDIFTNLWCVKAPLDPFAGPP